MNEKFFARLQFAYFRAPPENTPGMPRLQEYFGSGMRVLLGACACRLCARLKPQVNTAGMSQTFLAVFQLIVRHFHWKPAAERRALVRRCSIVPDRFAMEVPAEMDFGKLKMQGEFKDNTVQEILKESVENDGTQM